MNIALVVNAVLLLVFQTPLNQARQWPDGKGGFIRGELILVRTSEIVIWTHASPNRYLFIPKKSLREFDKKQMHRLDRNSHIDDFEDLNDELRAIANIHDARTLLDAASLFRKEDTAFVLTTFSAYLEACQTNPRLESGNIWALSTIIFEHPQRMYPDFEGGNKEIVTPRWPQSGTYEIRIVAGTPFWVRQKLAHSGPIWPGNSGLLIWIRDHAQIRKEWIYPSASPMESLELLGNESNECRRQAWQLVSHLFDENWNLVFEQEIDQERWARLNTMVESLDVKWDVETQQFKATQEADIPKAPDSWLPTKFMRMVR